MSSSQSRKYFDCTGLSDFQSHIKSNYIQWSNSGQQQLTILNKHLTNHTAPAGLNISV
jgi:hypothetical protein